MKSNANTENAETALQNEVAVISAVVAEGNDVFTCLSASLCEIRKLSGVKGYILRSETSALVDLSEPDKITQYASLSYQLNESAFEVADKLNLGEMESFLVEAKNVKVLCMRLGQNKICVFMDKSASHSWIIKRILL